MSLTSILFKAARLSADGRAVRRSVKTRSARPIVHRVARKAIHRAWGRSKIARWPR